MGFLRQGHGRPLALALQGGGAHGAFTWGVLDRLLEAGHLRFSAVSGTSAGAMNAIALAQGLMTGGADGAREALARFWEAIAHQGPFDWIELGDSDRQHLVPLLRALMHWTQLLSPYQLNPFGLNPLRDIVAAQFDFERLRHASPVRLLVAATHANSGRLRLFREHELSVDAALASACLPTLHHAVMIDGEPYWDGGYSANPALFPLVQMPDSSDLLIVMLSPLRHASLPVTAEDIRARALEFTFNAIFLREAHMLAQACATARQSRWPFVGPLERRLRRLRLHAINAQEALGALPAETRLIPHLPFLHRLRDLGRASAETWLREYGPHVGEASTADLVALLAPPAAPDAAVPVLVERPA